MGYRYWSAGKPRPKSLPIGCEYRIGEASPWHLEHQEPCTWTNIQRRWPVGKKPGKPTHEYPLLEKVVKHCEKRISQLMHDQTYTRSSLTEVIKLCNELMGK